MKLDLYLFNFLLQQKKIPAEVIEKYIEPYHFPHEKWEWNEWGDFETCSYSSYDSDFGYLKWRGYDRKLIRRVGSCRSCPCVCGYGCSCTGWFCYHDYRPIKARIYVNDPLFFIRCDIYRHCYDPLCSKCPNQEFSDPDHYYDDYDPNRCTTFEPNKIYRKKKKNKIKNKINKN